MDEATQRCSGTTVSFPKLNRRGKVVTITREQYLRDDLTCQSHVCDQCELDETRPSLSAEATYYLIPDAEALLHYIDLFEASSLSNIILLQTVMNSVSQEASQRVQNRLRDFRDDARRRVVYFSNEFFAPTHVPQSFGNSTEREAEAVRRAAAWFADHFAGKMLVVLLTGKNAPQRPSSHASGGLLEVLTMREYVSEYHTTDIPLLELCESLVSAHEQHLAEKEEGRHMLGSRKGGRSREQVYVPYRNMDLVTAEIKSERLFKGTFRASGRSCWEGYIRGGDKAGTKIVIKGSKNLNRAIDLDTVAVEICANPDQERHERLDDEEDTSYEISDESLMYSKNICYGRVVAVLQRNWRPYVCTLPEGEQGKKGLLDAVLAVPMDRKVPKIRIKTRQSGLLQGQRIVVHVDDWETTSQYPSGHYVRSLGDLGSLDTETAALLVEHGVSSVPFGPLTLSDLPIAKPFDPWSIPESELAVRRDLRGMVQICSIDPRGCVDIDDALHARTLPNGNLELGVHIADVTHFVSKDSPLDLEARARGTTVYLIDRRIDMLPEVLGTDLCSLRSGVDRLAVSVVWEFTPLPDFKPVNVWFGRTIIHSSYSLAYEDAQDIIGKGRGGLTSGQADTLRPDLVLLHAAASHIRKERFEAGALELESTELQIKLDGKSGAPVEIKSKDALDVHWVVAEMMILANKYVGRQCQPRYPTCALLRRHPPPQLDNFDELVRFASEYNVAIDPAANASLARSLDTLCKAVGNQPALRSLVKALATRAMSEAEYFSTGALPSDQWHHYGLAADFYTHFTSPIRRYSDVVAHRLLLGSLLTPVQSPQFTGETLRDVSDHLNVKHRASKNAQRDSQDWFLSLYFHSRSVGKLQKQVEEDVGVVTVVRPNGFVVFLPRYGIKGPVYLLSKEGEILPPRGFEGSVSDRCSVVHDEQEETIRVVGADAKVVKGLSFSLFDQVKVVVEVEEARAHVPPLKFRLASGPLTRRARSGDLQRETPSSMSSLLAEFNATSIEHEHAQEDWGAVDLCVDEEIQRALFAGAGVDSLYDVMDKFNQLRIGVGSGGGSGGGTLKPHGRKVKRLATRIQYK